MSTWNIWELPFFDGKHRVLAQALQDWQASHAETPEPTDAASLHAECRTLAASLAQAGLLEHAIPGKTEEGRLSVDVRSICLIREALAYVSPLADFVFAMQGIGTAALWLHGSTELQDRYLDDCRRGLHIAAFALSEPDGSSDVISIKTTAVAEGDSYLINGDKAWISNAGLADHYIVIARTGEVGGSRSLSAFMVDAGADGMTAGKPLDLVSPHPIASLEFINCRVPRGQLIGSEGDGLKVAMATLGIFRTSVGAAAVGLARRAMDESMVRVQERRLYDAPMAELDSVRMKLADMSVDLDTAMLATYRAAWCKDSLPGRHAREVATAKLLATESAQRVIDGAVQLFGAAGVTRGGVIERLYRDIRPMRIYEGASEVQRLIIGRSLLER